MISFLVHFHLSNLLKLWILFFGLSLISFRLTANDEILQLFLETGLRIDFDLEMPVNISTMHKEQEKIRNKGPFQYDPRVPQGERNGNQFSFRESLDAQEVNELLETQRSFSFTSSPLDQQKESIIAYALSRILAEQATAYAQYPWARDDRKAFALNQLSTRALQLSKKAGRQFYLLRALSNQLGLGFDWRSINNQVHEHFDTRTRSVLIPLSKTQLKNKNAQGLSDIRIQMNRIPGHRDIRFTLDLIQKLIHQLSSVIASDQMDETLLAAFEAMGAEVPKTLSKRPGVESTISIDYSSSFSNLRPPQFLESLEELESESLSFNFSATHTIASLMDDIENFSHSLDLASRQKLILWSYLLSQIAHQNGVSINFLSLESQARKFLNMDTENFETKFRTYLSEALRNQFRNDELSKLESRLKSRRESEIFLSLSFQSRELSSYPFLDNTAPVEIAWDPQASCQICQITNLQFVNSTREDPRWPTDPFELDYSYLYLNSGLKVDFEDAPINSLQYKDWKKLRPDPSLARSELDWRFSEIEIRENSLPKNFKELHDLIFDHLNQDYLYRMYQKVFALYGIDYSHDYRLSVGETNQILSMKHDIKPYYEKHKEQKYRDHQVSVGIIRLPNSSQLGLQALDQYFQEFYLTRKEILRERVEEFGTQIFQETKNLEFARKSYWDRLGEAWRKEEALHLGEDLALAWGSEAEVELHELNLSGSMTEIFNQIASETSDLPTDVQRKTYALIEQTKFNFDQDNPLLFPATPLRVGKEGSSSEVFIIFVLAYHAGEYDSLYDTQVEIEEEIHRNRLLQSRLGLLKKILGDGNLRPQALAFKDVDKMNRFLDEFLTSERLESLLIQAASIEIERQQIEKPWTKRIYLPRYQRISSPGAGLGAPGFGQ